MFNKTKAVKKKISPHLRITILLLFFIIYLLERYYCSKWPNTIYATYKIKKGLINFHSYSEYYEDIILYLLLFDIKKGFYIDVGAFDPIKVSVTKLFYLKGWNGINIEPQPGKIELFKKDRPNDINLQLAIGAKEGNVTFYVKDQCSTYVKKYSNHYENIINIKMDAMSNICKRYVPKGTEIDFCKIDVEGGEKNVLLRYDFINYRPKVFCIESTIPLTTKPNYILWEDILIKNNYTFIYSKGVNRYYVDNLIPGFSERKKYIKKYRKIYFTRGRYIYG